MTNIRAIEEEKKDPSKKAKQQDNKFVDSKSIQTCKESNALTCLYLEMNPKISTLFTFHCQAIVLLS